MLNSIILICFPIFVFLGIFLALMPMIPALSYMFAMSLIFGLLDGFSHLAAKELGALAIIWGLSLLVDWSAGLIGAKFGGASKKSLLYGIVGLIVGAIVMPPVGGFIGLFCGVLVAELWQNRSERQAFKAAAGSLIGAVSGMAVNFVLAIFFFGLFAYFVFW